MFLRKHLYYESLEAITTPKPIDTVTQKVVVAPEQHLYYYHNEDQLNTLLLLQYDFHNRAKYHSDLE
jgi:hypothetical protein